MSYESIETFPQSYWRDLEIGKNYPKLNEKITVDVGIVGAGIVGITAAYLLSKQNISVALIDAGKIFNGTSAHTTGKITAQHGLIYDELINNLGEKKARLYYEANDEALKFIEKTVEQLKIDCQFHRSDAFLYTNDDKYLKKLDKEQKAYERLKIDHDFVDLMPLNIPHKRALNMKNQAEFHPVKYLKKLLDECEKQSVQIYENTRAINVEFAKHPAIVTSDKHRIICKYVIQASHYPFYDGHGFYPTRMYADRSYIIAGKSDEQYPGGMYISAENPTRSIRSVKLDNKNIWLVGGDSHKTGQSEATSTHYEALQYFAHKHFNIKRTMYHWSAQDLVTLDKVPYIGYVSNTEKNVLVATGFRKWGMSTGTLAAKLMHNLIMNGKCRFEQLFSPGRTTMKNFIKYNTDVAKHLIKGKFEFPKGDYEKLNKDEAMITKINGDRTGIYKDVNERLHAVNTTCTHLGCEVNWNEAERSWDCPCHGSRFHYTGEVLNGPAVKPLERVELK